MKWEDDTIASLRKALANLYGSKEDSYLIVKDAKLDLAEIKFSDKAINNWFNILEYAREKQGSLDAIYETALRAFPDEPSLLSLSLNRTDPNIRDAFDRNTFANVGPIYCVVISPERDSGEMATPLCQQVRRAWENFSPQISVAVDQYRAGRRIGNTLQTAEVRAQTQGNMQFILAELPVARAFASQQSLTRAIEALCKAEVAVFDLTGFEPGIMFLLGVRSVARRGVTISSVGGEYTIGGALAIPFNLQLLNLSAHSEMQETKGAGLRPWELIGKKIQSGFRELLNLPRYLDLPAYDSVRELGVESSAYKGIQYSDRVLVLCPFSQTYEKRNWRFIDAELHGKLKQRLLKAGGAVDIQPRLERLLDQSTPRLVSQTLFESIRLTDMCLIDWTEQRANVMFEAGVRLATNPLGAVHVVEEIGGKFALSSEWPVQQEGLTRLFEPIGYRCRAGDTAAFDKMIARFEENLANNRRGFVYVAVGEALDRGSQRAALPLVDELIRSANILASDDQETTGISPILYHEVNKELVAEAEEGAAERRLAAWLFMDRRYTAQQIAAEPERREQFRLLSAQVRRWARRGGREDLIADIKSKSQAVLQATDQVKT
jgi:Effector-associated domain 1